MGSRVSILQLALAFAGGVLVAHHANGWVAAGMFLVLAGAAVVLRHRRLMIVTAIVWGMIGYLRAEPNRFVESGDSGLCRVDGDVLERRIVRVPPSNTRFGVAADYTRARIFVVESSAPALVGQVVDLYVSGHAVELVAGARVRFAGSLGVRPPPANPGERWTSRAGTPFLRVSHPDAIRVSRPTGIRSWRNDVRVGLAALLRQHLQPAQSSVAETLVLGERERLSESTAAAFRETGTGHLLAISGLHLGLIAWLLYGVAQRLTVSLRWQTLIVCGLVLLYAFLVEPRASVLRATVFILLGGLAVVRGRSVASVPLISTAAIVVLIVDPQQLWQPGAQLSFAAVVAIAAIIRFRIVETLTPQWFEFDEMTPYRWLRAKLVPVWKLALWGLLLWAATAPLAAYHFRWVTAWGALLHVVCFPLVVVAMATLLMAMVVSVWLPVAAPLWAIADAALLSLRVVVEAAAEITMFSSVVPEPNGLIVAAGYALMLAAVTAGESVMRRRACIALACVPVIAIVAAAWPNACACLRVTSLSVGHGLCVVVQTPDGRTMLYDVGSLSNPDRVGVQIADALRAMSVRRLDAVILSHTDQDHFGVIEPIVAEFPVGVVWCHQTFVESESKSVVMALNALAEANIPLETKSAGDILATEPAVLRVLHPARNAVFEDDNAESLVVEIVFAGRRILLTGDVDGAGQTALIGEPIAQVDVLFAPHHGGKTSNTAELNEWAQPSYVVSSSGRSSMEFLESIYPTATVFETSTRGAISIEVQPNGDVRVEGFRDFTYGEN